MEKHCTIDGADVAYWEYNATKTKTLILVHGFRGTHHGLLKIAEGLGDYRLIIPDLPGFGDSQAMAGEHSLENYVEWLRTFRAQVDTAKQSYIVGHSFGTIVVSHYAATHPATVRKIVLINPIGSPALHNEQRFITQFVILYYWLGRKLPASAARAWISAKPLTKAMSVTMRKSKDRTIRRYIDSEHYAHYSSFASPRQLAEVFHASVSNDVSQVAEELSMPTLMIVGDKDALTSLAKQRALHKRMPNAQLAVISDVGHLTHYETPGQVAKAIIKFIA